MATCTDLVIRPITAEDAGDAWALSNALGWPHRLEDWNLFIRLGRGFVAIDSGTVVGTALWWAYGQTHGSIGMVIVSPAQQGKGIGRRLMDLIMGDAGDRVLRLNATTAGLKLYRDLGFVECGTVRQFQGVAVNSADALDDLSAIAELDDGLKAFDHQASGVNREVLLMNLLRAGDAYAVRDGDVVNALAFRRRFGRGHLIGPVVAVSAVPALDLIRKLIQATPGFVRLDVVDGRPGLPETLVASGLADAGTVTMMQRGAGATAPETVFALAGQALG